jgi:hypothetical protein
VPVAADLSVRDSGSVVVLKTTYDENFKSLSPGQLLHEDTFRHLFADPSLERIEFFGRVMDWHTRWTENVRTQYHVNYYRWAWLKALHRRLRARAVKRPSAAPDESQPRSAAP